MKYSFFDKDKALIKRLSKIKNDSLIIFPHLGLGDQIINNGAFNVISKNFRKIYLVSWKKFQNSMDYLYSSQENIEMLYIDSAKHAENFDYYFSDVLEFAKSKNLKVLKLGFENKKKGLPFYEAFYKQVKIDYQDSYKHFNVVRNKSLEEKLNDHVFKYFNVNPEKYRLVHNEHSSGVKNLRIDDGDTIYVNKESDPFNNLFLYIGLINNAKEIHCLNSSFCHLVDRVKSKGDLFYHDLIGSKLELNKNWITIDY